MIVIDLLVTKRELLQQNARHENEKEIVCALLDKAVIARNCTNCGVVQIASHIANVIRFYFPKMICIFYSYSGQITALLSSFCRRIRCGSIFRIFGLISESDRSIIRAVHLKCREHACALDFIGATGSEDQGVEGSLYGSEDESCWSRTRRNGPRRIHPR